MLCSRFLRAESSYTRRGLFYRGCERAFNLLLAGYEAGLKWVLRHQVFMLGVALLTAVGTVILYQQVPKGFFPSRIPV